MGERISQRELRNDSGRIMRALDEGKSFTVTRNRQPVGELRPLRRHRFVDSRAAVAIFQHAPSVSWKTLRADLDDVADQGTEPRA